VIEGTALLEGAVLTGTEPSRSEVVPVRTTDGVGPDASPPKTDGASRVGLSGVKATSREASGVDVRDPALSGVAKAMVRGVSGADARPVGGDVPACRFELWATSVCAKLDAMFAPADPTRRPDGVDVAISSSVAAAGVDAAGVPPAVTDDATV